MCLVLEHLRLAGKKCKRRVNPQVLGQPRLGAARQVVRKHGNQSQKLTLVPEKKKETYGASLLQVQFTKRGLLVLGTPNPVPLVQRGTICWGQKRRANRAPTASWLPLSFQRVGRDSITIVYPDLWMDKIHFAPVARWFIPIHRASSIPSGAGFRPPTVGLKGTHVILQL